MKPLIGISTYQSSNANGQPIVVLQQSYVNAVAQAGGVPVLIPSSIHEEGWDALYSRLDGILLSGGGDISLDHFAGEPHPRIYDIEPERDSIELQLAKSAAKDGKPLLGICRGCQVMNVALGGTLYTHIPDQLKGALDHAYPGHLRKTLVHDVRIEEGTRTADVMEEPILSVNSLHHQGIKDIAPMLRSAGVAPDGLVEVVEIPDHPFAIGVQWHPEWLTDQVSARKLFQKFVMAAGKA